MIFVLLCNYVYTRDCLLFEIASPYGFSNDFPRSYFSELVTCADYFRADVIMSVLIKLVEEKPSLEEVAAIDRLPRWVLPE